MATATIAIPANPRLDSPENGMNAVALAKRPLMGRNAEIAAGTRLVERTTPAPALLEPAQRQALIDSILDRRTILEKLRDQLDATKTVTASFMGQISDSMEIADNQARGKAIELGLKLHRLIDGDAHTSIGTVNVMFAGALPDWLQGQPQDQACRAVAVGANPELVQTGTVDSAVHTGNNGDNAPPPLSAIEGTAAGPGGCTHTHPANLVSLKCDDTVPVTGAFADGNFPGASVPVEGVPVTAVPAKTKLSQRVVKTRKARLPVFRGDK